MPQTGPTTMNAVILVTTFLGYGHDRLQHGGRPRIVRDLAYLLRDLGLLVTIAQKGERDAAIPFDSGIRVRKFKVPVRSWTDPLFALRTRKLVREADICCYASCEDGFPFFAKRCFGIQHGIWWDKPTGGALVRGVLDQIHFHRLSALCRSAVRVICVDTNVINWLRLHGRPGHEAAAKCVYIPNYLDSSAFPRPSQRLIQQRYERPRLVYLRRFEPPRGPLLFVEMCKILRDNGLAFSASMIGWGSQEAAVRELAARLGLSEVIDIHESDFEGVPEALAGATLALVPTIYSEGTSLSCIEAIGMGIPVIATDVGGLGNLILPGFNGYIAKADAGRLASAVLAALSSREHYTALANNCVRARDALLFSNWKEEVKAVLGEAGLAIPSSGAGSGVLTAHG